MVSVEESKAQVQTSVSFSLKVRAEFDVLKENGLVSGSFSDLVHKATFKELDRLNKLLEEDKDG